MTNRRVLAKPWLRWASTVVLLLGLGAWTLSYEVAYEIRLYKLGDIGILSSGGALLLMLDDGWTSFSGFAGFNGWSSVPGICEPEGSSGYPRWKGVHAYTLVLRNGSPMRVVMLSYWIPCLLLSILVWAQWRRHWRRMRELHSRGFEAKPVGK